jgi:hypothetical protein
MHSKLRLSIVSPHERSRGATRLTYQQNANGFASHMVPIYVELKNSRGKIDTSLGRRTTWNSLRVRFRMGQTLHQPNSGTGCSIIGFRDLNLTREKQVQVDLATPRRNPPPRRLLHLYPRLQVFPCLQALQLEKWKLMTLGKNLRAVKRVPSQCC